MEIVCWIKKNRYLRDKKRNGTWCIWINFTKKPWSGRWGKLPNQRNRRWALSPLLPIWRRTSRRQRQCKTFRGGTTHSNLTQLLGISPSRVSEYLSGKSEPTLKIGREISRKLHIDANIVLGVWVDILLFYRYRDIRVGVSFLLGICWRVWEVLLLLRNGI